MENARQDVRVVKPRDAAIDWMRALSILYIVGFWHLHDHTGFLTWYKAPGFARLTVFALALFVLISGNLAGRAGQQLTPTAIVDYYRRRLIRIYPPYLLALIVFTVLKLSTAAFVASALMLTMFVPPPPPTLWFMTMIVLFYLVAPFLLAMAKRPLALILIVSLVWITLFALDRFVTDIEDRLLIYLPAFAAGMLTANRDPSRKVIWLSVAALIAVAGYALSLAAPRFLQDQSLWMAPWATGSAVFVFIALSGGLPKSRIIEELSLGGFFLYLFHRPIFVVLLKLVRPETALQRELLLVGVGLPVAVGFGIAAQRTYDWMIARLSHGRRSAQQPLGA